MNKIYKLVWSKVRNTWVVASEMAKGHGKSSSPEGKGIILKSMILMALFGSFMTAGMSPVAAEVTPEQRAQAQAVIEAIKNDTQLSQQLAAGVQQQLMGNSNGDVTLPYLAVTTDSENSKDKHAKADGGSSVVLGYNSSAKATAVTVGAGAGADIGGVAIGYKTDANIYATALGRWAHAKAEASIAIGAGNGAKANAETLAYGAIAIGPNTRVSEQSEKGIAIGTGTHLLGNSVYSVAVGPHAKIKDGKGASAFGLNAEAGSNGTALGALSRANGLRSTSIGLQSRATMESGVALGAYSLANTGMGKIGYVFDGKEGSSLDLQNSMAVAGIKERYIELGKTVTLEVETEYDNLVNAYENASETDEAARAQAKANLEKWKTDHSDLWAKLKEKRRLEMTWLSKKGAVSVGNEEKGISRQITNLAAGTEDTDAVNVAQLKVVNTKVEKNKTDISQINQNVASLKSDIQKGSMHYFSVNSNAVNSGSNYDNKGASGDSAMAIGANAMADETEAIAIGENAWARGEYGVTVGAGANSNIHSVAVGNQSNGGRYGTALGYQAGVTTKGVAVGQNANAYGWGTIAIGAEAQIEKGDSNKRAIAIGYGANLPKVAEDSIVIGGQSAVETKGSRNTVVGSNSKVLNSDDAVIIGASAQVKSQGGVALGSHARVAADNSLALGYNSLASIADDVKTEAYLSKEAFKKENGIVSVGNKAYTIGGQAIAENYRRITNVAGGADDHDAVNVAQLEVVNDKADKNAQNITNINTDIKTLKGVSGKVIDGTNTTVEVGDENGTKTYKVNVAANGAIADGNTGIVTGDTVYKFINPISTKVSTMETTVNNLKGGFTIKGATSGTADITLGETTKPAITFKAETKNDDTTGVFTAKVDADKNVTYTLNTKKLKEEMGLAQGVGSMSSWKLKAGTTDAESITDGNEVEFAVAEANKGLTVKREGKKIQYGIDSDKLIDNINNNTTRKITNVDLSNNSTITEINKKINNLTTNTGSGVHYFSVKSDDKNASNGTNWDNDGATGEDAIAIGRKARAYGMDSQSMGENAWSIGNYSQAWGYYALAGAEEGIDKAAYDALSDAEKENYTLREMSIGGVDKSLYYRTKFKEYTNDEFNALTEQERKDLQANKGYGYHSGKKVWTPTPRAIAIGHLSKALGAATVAVGNLAEATGIQSTAIGTQANASGSYSFAAGDRASAQKTGTIAIGMKANASGEWSTAIGSFAEASGKWGTALGLSAKAQSENGVALGASASVDKKGAASLGYKAQSNAENGVALGAYSFADREKGKIGYVLGGDNSTLEKALESIGQKAKYDELTGKIDPLKDEYNGLVKAYQKAPAKSAEETTAKQNLDAWVTAHPDFLSAVKEKQQMTDAWQSGNGAVSVGKAGATRQITHVAAGSEDTDAVNVAQLKVVNKKADDNATKLSTVENNITNLKNVSGKVIDGTNTTVEVGDDNGTKTYKVNVAANGQIAENNTGIVTGDTVYKFVNPIKTQVTNMETTVNNLKGGFTIKDAASGTANITLGEATKPAITFKAETEDKDGATSALTATVDDQKNVTYKLNTKKLKEEMGLTQGVGSMSSWKLKATGDTDSQTIADGDEVEFEVETADKGLTVKRNGKKIQYGIDSDKLIDNINSNTTKKITNVDGDNIDLSKNTSIKMINENITKLAGKATKVTVNGKDDNSDDANANLKITKNTVDGQTIYDLSLNDNITIGKDGKDGKIGINGKDGKSADITVGKGEAGVDGKDGITRIIYKDQGNKTHEVATLDDGLKFKGDNDDVVIRKLNTQLNITGGAKAEDLSDDNIGVVGTDGDNGGMTVKLSKKLKGLTSAEFVDGDNITNITGGNVTITRKEGNTTNKVDLWELNKTVNNITAGTTDVSSWKLQVNGTDKRMIKKGDIVNFTNGKATKVTVKDNDVTVDLNDATKKQINDNTTDITNMKNDIKNIQTTVNNIDTKIDQKIEGSKIKVEGDDTTGVKVKEDKVNGKVKGYKVSLDKKVQVGNVAIDGKDGKGEITGLTNKDWDGENIVSGRAATEDQLKAAMGKVQAQSRTTVKGSTNITVKPDTKGASEYTVELAKDITVDSVTAKTVKADEYKVGDKTYINDKGINANKNKITNVADGVVSKDSKDAVNGSQLFATNQQVANNMYQINNLRDESREGDALGAAMAALKPIGFDPYQRSQVMAGVGYYRGKEAVALGLAHYKNEDLMFHGGIAYAGNSELMANIGVTYRFGSKDDRDIKHDRNLRMPQYAEGPISSVYILQDEVDRLTKENKEAKDRIDELEAKLEKVLAKVK